MQMLFSIIAAMIPRCRPIRLLPTRRCKRVSFRSMCPGWTGQNFQASSTCGKWSLRPKLRWENNSVMSSFEYRVLVKFGCIAALLFPAVFCPTSCVAANAIYEALTGAGVKISPQLTFQLPKPALEDSLTPQQQRRVLESLIAGKYDWDTFVRKSVVSPFVLKMSEGAVESRPMVRKLDLYFVAFGSLDSLKREDYLTKRLTLASNDQSE